MLASDIPAQVDTAADMTVLPQTLVDQLGLVQIDRVPARGFDGHVSFVPSYLASIAIRGLSPTVVKILASRDEPFVLLGRDVLNRHRLVLDGPDLSLEVV
jgi:predicted aspartyl protease